MDIYRGVILNVVPEAGIEPARSFWLRGILSPLRLPIPPLRHIDTPTYTTPILFPEAQNFSSTRLCPVCARQRMTHGPLSLTYGNHCQDVTDFP